LTHDVSVLVAARDAEAFIEESVRSALDQTVAPSEIVVVDDGSTDATATIAEALDPRVVVVRREPAGVGASRNAGLAVVSRPWVALLDADDVWLPTKLERQLAAFADDPAREAVFTWFDEFADADHPPPPGTRVPRTGQSASLSTGVLMPRQVIDRIGPFGTGESADWFGWWAHARALGVVEHTVPEVLYRRRIHSANNSFRRGDRGQSFVAAARAHLHDVRARGTTDVTGAP
jgi:glycosyltransferase involved in cell wall biosynthesis